MTGMESIRLYLETLFVVRKNKAYFLIFESEKGIPLIKRYNMEWK